MDSGWDSNTTTSICLDDLGVDLLVGNVSWKTRVRNTYILTLYQQNDDRLRMNAKDETGISVMRVTVSAIFMTGSRDTVL